MTGRLVTVFGGSGFLGRYVVRRLAKQGARIRVAVRHPNRALFLKPMGDVGQIQIVQANVRNAESVARAVAGADAVINLVGILFEGRRQKFHAVQAEGAGNIATAAKAAGVKFLILLSAIGASPESASHYARAKADGEGLVRDAFPDATILRPSFVFGPEDGFFNRFALLAKLMPFLPLIGGATRFQPVYVDDVAAAVVATLGPGANAAGKTYELGGPRIYTLKQMLQLMLKEIRFSRFLIPVPLFAAKMEAFFLQMLPNPLLTVDQVRLLAVDNVVADASPGLAELGITPTALEVILPDYLWRFRSKGQFSEGLKA